MSGYKPGRSEATSPSYKKGVEDGEMDAGLVGSCPPWPPIGPNPPNPAYPVMYMQGYDSVPKPEHYCDKSCGRGAA